MRTHNFSEIPLLGSGPSGRAGHSPRASFAVMTAAPFDRPRTGDSSVMHSSISTAKECTSELVVGGAFSRSVGPGAECLVTPLDAVLKVAVSVLSSTILVIPKSQIFGSPLAVYRQPPVHQSRIWNLPRGR